MRVKYSSLRLSHLSLANSGPGTVRSGLVCVIDICIFLVIIWNCVQLYTHHFLCVSHFSRKDHFISASNCAFLDCVWRTLCSIEFLLLVQIVAVANFKC